MTRIEREDMESQHAIIHTKIEQEAAKMGWYVPSSVVRASLQGCMTIMLCRIAQQVPTSNNVWTLGKHAGLSSTCHSW